MLKSLCCIEYPPELLELFILDDGSISHHEDCRKLPFRMRAIDGATARAVRKNLALRESTGTLILFLQDIILEPPAVLSHAAIHNRCTCRIMVRGTSIPFPGLTILDRLSLSATFTSAALEGACQKIPLFHNLSVRRADIAETGPFDEDPGLSGLENLDLGYRLMYRSGLSLRECLDARGWQYGKIALDEVIAASFQAGISFVTFLRKHPDALMMPDSSEGCHNRGKFGGTIFEFLPLTVLQARQMLGSLAAYEQAHLIDPSPGTKRNLRRSYREILDYSFAEGAFLRRRAIEDNKSPLLSGGGEPRSHRKLTFLWRGLLDHGIGFGVVSHSYVEALRELGYLVDTERLEISPNSAAERQNPDAHRYHFSVHHHWEPAAKLPVGPCKIQVSAFETTQLPPEWVKLYNRMDEIWVPSAFCRDSFLESGVQVPVSIIPHGVDTGVFSPSLSHQRHALHEHFCFMSMGELWEYKGFDILLQAYFEEFSAADQVLLAIKLRARPGCPDGFAHESVCAFIESVREKIGRKKFPLLFLDYREKSRSEIARFLDAGDAYVCTSRGEGFCLPLLESMSLGKIVISTAFGGQMDYLTDENSWLIHCRLVPARATAHPHHRQGCWAEASIPHLRHTMRSIYEDSGPAWKKAHRAAGDVRAGWNLEEMRRKISLRIDRLYEDYHRGRGKIFWKECNLPEYGQQPEAYGALKEKVQWSR